MRSFGIIFIIGFLFAGCKTESSRSGCHDMVIVIDKSGLDGCSILLKLENDEVLEPIEWSVSRPELIVGKKYLINYEEIPAATICMAGKTVRITCITSES